LLLSCKSFKNNSVFVVGLVDNDKAEKTPPFLRKFDVIQNTDDLIILKEKESEKHLIKLVPAFEKWIWKVASDCDIPPSQYGYNKWEDIKNITKTDAVFMNGNFKKFINAVIDKDPPPIQTLRFWLSKVF